MRANISVYLEDGSVFAGVAELRTSGRAVRTKGGALSGRESSAVASAQIAPNFAVPLRPFMKTHGTRLSGPKKLTLLIAHLAKGKTDVSIARADVEKQWSKMEALMGGPYNGAYDTRARDQGWIHSPKFGQFSLLQGWEAILQ